MNDMRGKWDGWYAGIKEAQPYGDTLSYHLAENYLFGMEVEDWGCGKGYFSTVHTAGYTGVDGTQTPFSEVVADLREYVSNTEGILLRHVLEHNYDWQEIFVNALDSVSVCLVLILFTPMSERTEQIAWNPGPDVPDISFSHDDIIDVVSSYVMETGKEFEIEWKDIKSGTQYGVERIYAFEVQS